MRLMEARRRAGLGRVKAAKLCGTDASTLYRYETGRRVAGIASATRICRGLGLDIRQIDEFAPALEQMLRPGKGA